MRTMIIAEAGVNHNGDVNLALKLIDQAKIAGVDIIKFQTFVSKSLVSNQARKASYQIENTKNNDTQYQMLKKLELTNNDFIKLKNYCDKIGITFLSTGFDFESVDLLKELGIDLWKIPSGEITNLPYLIKIARFGQPVILSTGMSNMQEIEDAISALKKNGAGIITLLHCTTEYPAPFEDVNLRAIHTMRDRFGLSVGYSDHTKGIEAAIAAVAMGATVIEKHFTLDRNMVGPDHQASLEPNELAQMVSGIRNIESAMGDGIKKASNSEIKNIDIARKSIVAKHLIRKGELFTEQNISTKRPGNGLSPMKWFEVLGTTALRDYQEDEMIEL